MVALRMPIHFPPCALVALPAATDTWLGNAYLDCPALLWQDVRLLASALVVQVNYTATYRLPDA